MVDICDNIIDICDTYLTNYALANILLLYLFLLVGGENTMNVQEHISAQEVADKWDVTVRQVQKLCNDGKIPGAIRFGRAWAIPKDTQKPTTTRKVKPGPKKKTANETGKSNQSKI